jgi:hypothetical protein
MTATMSDAALASQEQFLGTVRQSQEAVVEAVAAWAKAVEGMTPSTPSLPGFEQLPRPQAVIESAFDFAQQLLDAQRDFAREVIAAASPVLEKAPASNGAKQ